MIIAVDGPASSGKGTIAKMIAQHFSLPYLNTGALYRQLAFESLERGFDLHEDENDIIKLVLKMHLHDLESEKIHNERIGQAASIIARNQNIRSALFYLQKNFANSPNGAVLDGRDIGTVICPDADYKFFITASLEERAKRRFLQLTKKNPNLTQEEVFLQLKERDLRDQNRDVAPLLKAQDAFEIDSSNLNIDQVFAEVINYIENHKK